MASPNTTFSAGSILTAADMNDLPFGYVDNAAGTATTAIVGGTPLTVLSKSITIVAGRLYRLTAGLAFQPSANSGGNALYMTCTGVTSRTFWYQATTISANLPVTVGGTIFVSATDFGVTTGSSSKTINLVLRCGGAGALSTNPDAIVGANSSPQFIYVEDMGLT